MEQAAEAHAWSLHADLTGRASASVWPPRGMPSLPPVGHYRCPQPIQPGDEADWQSNLDPQYLPNQLELAKIPWIEID